MRNTTLLFLAKKTDVVTDICLAMKKRGFGVGRWNGVGGKVDEGEMIEDATVRETKEEIGVTVEKFEKVAEHTFIFPNKPDWNQIVHVYVAEKWNGEVEESEEMSPKWFSVEQIPFQDMWPDDIFWLPKVISGKLLKTQFSFGDGDVILDQKIEEVLSF